VSEEGLKSVFDEALFQGHHHLKQRINPNFIRRIRTRMSRIGSVSPFSSSQTSLNLSGSGFNENKENKEGGGRKSRRRESFRKRWRLTLPNMSIFQQRVVSSS